MGYTHREAITNTKEFEVDGSARDAAVSNASILFEEIAGRWRGVNIFSSIFTDGSSLRSKGRAIMATIRLGPDCELILLVFGETRIGEEDLEELPEV